MAKTLGKAAAAVKKAAASRKKARATRPASAPPKQVNKIRFTPSAYNNDRSQYRVIGPPLMTRTREDTRRISKAELKGNNADYIKSLFAPEHNIPVGIPDRFAAPTTTMKLTSVFTVTTDATGNFLGVVSPNALQHFSACASAAGVWTAPVVSPVNQLTQFNLAVAQYRPVSMSATFTSSLAVTNATGVVLIGLMPTSAANYYTGGVAAASQALLLEWKRCSMTEATEDGCRIVLFPRDPSSATYRGAQAVPPANYVTLGNAGTNEFDEYAFVFCLLGCAASSAVGTIEVNFNIEALPLPGQAFLPKKVYPADSTLLDVAANIAAAVSPIMKRPTASQIEQGFGTLIANTAQAMFPVLSSFIKRIS